MDKNEAIKILREAHDKALFSARTALETLIPELAESEDERIRKDIITYLSNELHNIKQLTPRTNEIEAWIAYLEKQKEPLTPEEKMNHPLYLEGFDVGKKVGEVLKEQKPVEITPNQFDGITYGMKGYSSEKPAEWSEEDEKMRNAILQDLANIKAAYPKINIQVEFDWLKSLRFQPKQDVLPSLSEKEIICLKRALDYLRKEHNRYGGEDFTNEIAVLEWLITHPVLARLWKPSEEQMEQLRSAAVLPEFGPMVTTRKQFPELELLYNDLKKLM